MELALVASSAGSAQHPIALGAVLVVPIPLAVYFARTAGARWWTSLPFLARCARHRSRAVVSADRDDRSSSFSQAAGDAPDLAAAHSWSRDRSCRRPRRDRHAPQRVLSPGGIIAEQSQLGLEEDPNLAGAGSVSSARCSVKPRATRSSAKGLGRGSRVFSTFRNAPILDNQWLNTILELGTSVRRSGSGFSFAASGASAVRHGSRGRRRLAFAGLAASITGFGVGMLTFDAFSFTQITFVFWILLGLSAAMLRINDEMRAEVREFAPRRRRPTRTSSTAVPRSRRSARRFPLVGAGASRRLAQVAIESARIGSRSSCSRPAEARREVEIDLCVVRVRVARAPLRVSRRTLVRRS